MCVNLQIMGSRKATTRRINDLHARLERQQDLTLMAPPTAPPQASAALPSPPKNVANCNRAGPATAAADGDVRRRPVAPSNGSFTSIR